MGWAGSGLYAQVPTSITGLGPAAAAPRKSHHCLGCLQRQFTHGAAPALLHARGQQDMPWAGAVGRAGVRAVRVGSGWSTPAGVSLERAWGEVG